MGSNKVCLIGLDNHTVHFDGAQTHRVSWQGTDRSVLVRGVHFCFRGGGGYFCQREQNSPVADTD